MQYVKNLYDEFRVNRKSYTVVVLTREVLPICETASEVRRVLTYPHKP